MEFIVLLVISYKRRVMEINWNPLTFGGMRQCSWLRYYATSRKVAGTSPDEVDFFNLPIPSSRTMALGSTQPLTEMSTRNLPAGVKGGWRMRLTTLPPSVSWLSKENVGASMAHTTLWAFTAGYRDSFFTH
jgi:hypothetical protein